MNSNDEYNDEDFAPTDETSVMNPITPEDLQKNEFKQQRTYDYTPEEYEEYRTGYDPELDEIDLDSDLTKDQQLAGMSNRLRSEINENQSLVANNHSLSEEINAIKEDNKREMEKDKNTSRNLWISVFALVIILVCSLFFLFNQYDKRVAAEGALRTGENTENVAFNDVKNERDQAISERDSANNDLKNKNDQIADLQNKIDGLNKSNKDKDKEIKDLQKKIDSANRDIERLQRQNDSDNDSSSSPTTGREEDSIEDNGDSIADLFRRN